MRKILELAANDLRIFFISRGNLISLILVPVVMTLVVGIFAGGASGEPASILVDIVDEDNSALSQQLLESLRRANSSLVLCPMDDDVEGRCQVAGAESIDLVEAIARIEAGISQTAILIPEGFAAEVRSFEPVQVELYTQEELGFPGAVEQAANAALQRVNAAAVAARTGSNVLGSAQGLAVDEATRREFAADVYARADQLWQSELVRVNYETSGVRQPGGIGTALQQGLGQSVPGMGSAFVMFTVFGGMTALIVERKQWTLQRLATAPLSRAQLLGGKILSRFTLGILQFLIVFVVGVVAGIQLGQDPLALSLVAVSFTLAITALSFAVGSRLENEAQAAGLSLLLALVLAPLGGAWWPLEIVPQFMQVVGHISPVAWAMDAFHALIFNEGSLGDVVLPVMVLLGLAGVAFGLGVAWFKVDA